MIAIKTRCVHGTSTVLGPEGSPIEVIVDRPDGFEDRAEAMPLEEPRVDAPTLWLVADDAVPEDDPRRAGPLDVPVRDDLPVGHPLRGKRALRVVPAGMPDCTLDAAGRLTPLDLKTGEPVAEPAELGEEVPRGGP